MKIKSIFFFALLLGVGFTSCKKYPDGPAISLKSKKARVENTWVIEQAIRNGNDVTSDYSIYTLKLNKDGDANLKATVDFGGGFVYQGNTDGTWEFNSNKTNIIFDYENNDFDNVYQILKLKTDELWIREIGGEDELHLKPQ